MNRTDCSQTRVWPDTFPIVKRKDEAQLGSYLTKDNILALYDALTEAKSDDRPFVSPLTSPPVAPSCCHPPRETGSD